MRSLRSVGTLILLVGLLAAGCDPGAGEETMVPTTTTIAGGSATTTAPTTTTTAPTLGVDHIRAWSPPFVAVSAEEAWAFDTGIDWAGVARFRDGTWAWAWFTFDTDLPGFEAVGQARSGLAVAPDGTVWVSGPGGVFSFDGVEWTRRFDYAAGGVAVAPDGTVWVEGVGWLARWDGGSWVSVGTDSPEPPHIPEDSELGAYCGPRPGVATSDGEVWMVECVTLYVPAFYLLHYDGATLWGVDVDGTTIRELTEDTRPNTEETLPWYYTWLDVEAAPDGGVWTLMNYATGDREVWLLGRFDGEAWTTYTPPPFLKTTYHHEGPYHLEGPAMASGPDGRVWFGADDGLLAFDGTDWTYHLQGQTVSAVDVAPDGTVWYVDQDGAHTLSEGASP